MGDAGVLSTYLEYNADDGGASLARLGEGRATLAGHQLVPARTNHSHMSALGARQLWMSRQALAEGRDTAARGETQGERRVPARVDEVEAAQAERLSNALLLARHPCSRVGLGVQVLPQQDGVLSGAR